MSFKTYNVGPKVNFDNFDPENFDPSLAQKYNSASGNDAGSVLQAAKAGQQMQVNLTLNNPTSTVKTFELWNYIDSMVNRRKAQYASGNYQYIPQDSLEGLKAVAVNGGTVGWTQDGDLMIGGNYNAPIPDPTATISCGEIAYRAFFNASGITPFQVSLIRMTVDSQNQIDKVITHFVTSYSGGIKENKISPRAFFRPNQFQDLTIDITTAFTIGIERKARS